MQSTSCTEFGRRRARTRTAVLAAMAAATALVVPWMPKAKATSAFEFQRLAGSDRYDTARVISTGSFTTAATAIVATGENFPDALAGNFLAGNRTAPILLVRRTQVPAATTAALQALKTKNVVLLGGPDAIDPTVEVQLRATDSTAAGGGKLDVTRIGGANRYETAKQVAAASGSVGATGGKRTAIVASGANFPDALASGPLAWALKFPTVLTDPRQLSPEARQTLTDRGIQQVLIAGGANAVSSAVESAINDMGIPTARRFAGADRSDTSRLIAEYAIANLGFKNSHINVASGDQRFLGADALVLGPHGGNEDPTVNLVTNSSDDGGRVVDFAAAHKATLTSGHAAGGTVPLTDAALDRIANAAGRGPAGYVFSPSTQTVKTVGTGYGDAGTAITYTVADVGADNVRLALFPCNGPGAPTVGSSSVTFAAPGATPAAGPAVGEGTTDAGGSSGVRITTVNGAPVTAAKAVGPINPTGTSLQFTVNTDGADCATPVAYRDANGNDRLDVAANGKPSEPAGAGGRAVYVPADGPAGAIPASGTGTVTFVDKPDSLFVLDNKATYRYKDGDVFQIKQGPLSTCTAVTKAEFTAALSVDDVVSGTYSKSAASTFCIDDVGPKPPATVGAAPTGAGSATVTWPDSTTRSVAAYNVYRRVKPAGPTCPDAPSGYDKVAVVPDSSPNQGSGAPYSYDDGGLVAGTTYCYAVSAVDRDGDESAPTGGPSAGATTGNPTAPSSTQLTFASTDALVTSGDTLTVAFDQPVTVDAGSFSLTLADNDGTVGSITPANATIAASGDGRTVTYTLTGAPTSANAGTASGLDYTHTVEVLAQSGVSNGAGAWNLAKSGRPDHSRVFALSNLTLPAAPTASSATAPNQVNVTCPAGTTGKPVRVYNGQGVLIGSSTCTGSAQTVTTSTSFAAGNVLYVTVVGTTASEQESQSAQITATP